MIAILDYGSGNLRSAQRAFAASGADVVVTSDEKICLDAKGLVVPGVGAFQACMRGLLAVNGDEIIRARFAADRPTLGICVGMQILFASSSESSRDGSILPGVGMWNESIARLSAPVLPHMGWNTVESPKNSVLFRGISEESFYFVHSFAAKESDAPVVTWSEYGERFVASAEDGSLSATQFHPEKSGGAGLRLIKNWVESI
ncbi:MAG: imidazole glycerol phosphate synthase subunit HisH [Actinobacteria bacterium]|nr:imidazole glycerol phosphate synthase subunit HisH [Actinomycetota bacterium]